MLRLRPPRRQHVVVSSAIVALVLAGVGCATISRSSVRSNEQQANDASFFDPSLSGDGRYVAFTSTASNLVQGDTNNSADVFVRDHLNGTTRRMSISTGGAEGNSDSIRPAISADGRYVAFDRSRRISWRATRTATPTSSCATVRRTRPFASVSPPAEPSQLGESQRVVAGSRWDPWWIRRRVPLVRVESRQR